MATAKIGDEEVVVNEESPRVLISRIEVLFLLLMFSAAALPAQTLLQRCIGSTPGREPAHTLGPSPATMQFCRQLPGWDVYEQAGQRFQAGDHAGAARLAQQAAQMGNPMAQLRLATMYQRGDGVPQNAQAALRLMRAAAMEGEPIAQVNMGDIYEYANTRGYEGYGLRDDWDTAAKFWMQSAEQGWADGEYRVGRAYQYGIGLPLNLQQAIVWYDKAAAQGHAQASYFAKYLRDNHGFDGSSRDDSERAMLGNLTGRTMPFSPPQGTTFHHLSERLAFVHNEFVAQEDAKAKAAYEMRMKQACERSGQSTCYIPPYPGH